MSAFHQNEVHGDRCSIWAVTNLLLGGLGNSRLPGRQVDQPVNGWLGITALQGNVRSTHFSRKVAAIEISLSSCRLNLSWRFVFKIGNDVSDTFRSSSTSFKKVSSRPIMKNTENLNCATQIRTSRSSSRCLNRESKITPSSASIYSSDVLSLPNGRKKWF